MKKKSIMKKYIMQDLKYLKLAYAKQKNGLMESKGIPVLIWKKKKHGLRIMHCIWQLKDSFDRKKLGSVGRKTSGCVSRKQLRHIRNN